MCAFEISHEKDFSLQEETAAETVVWHGHQREQARGDSGFREDGVVDGRLV